MTKIYEAENHLFIHTGYTTPQKHCHKAAHIIVSLEEEMMIATVDNKCKCRGILIPSEVSHQIDTNGNPVLVFLYDSTTDAAKNIRDVECLSNADCDEIVKTYLEFANGDVTAERYAEFYNIVLKKTGLTDRKRTISHDCDIVLFILAKIKAFSRVSDRRGDRRGLSSASPPSGSLLFPPRQAAARRSNPRAPSSRGRSCRL